MARSLRSIPERERLAVVIKRLNASTKGLGYWAAADYIKRKEYAENKTKKQ